MQTVGIARLKLLEVLDIVPDSKENDWMDLFDAIINYGRIPCGKAMNNRGEIDSDKNLPKDLEKKLNTFLRRLKKDYGS